MKKLIRQILREETSGLTDAQIKSGYNLMNMITKGYHWYHDTPEQPFRYDKGTIWLINPETKKWMLQLGKSGKLWYYYNTSDTFYRYINMQKSDFELFINIWVEDVLKNVVLTTSVMAKSRHPKVEDVLKKGVLTTIGPEGGGYVRVKDVLKNGKQMK